METDRWLARVRHDLVKRLVWPARDRRDLGGAPGPGRARRQADRRRGARRRPRPALWAALRGRGTGPAPARSTPSRRRWHGPLAAAEAGDLDGVLALEPAFDGWRAPWRRFLGRGAGYDAAPAGDRRSRPDGGDGPPPDAAVRDRHPLRPPHPLPGLRGADARLPAPLRARLRRGGRGARAAGRAPRSGRARPALRAPRGAPAARGQVGAAGRSPRRGAAALEAAAAAPGAPDPREAARDLPDAAGGHADDDRLRPRRRAAGRSAGLPVRERGGRQPQPGRRDLARAGAVAQRAGGADLLGARAGHDRAAAADRDGWPARRCRCWSRGRPAPARASWPST